VSYTVIDPILERWAARHDLLIATEYKDSAVRSTDVVGRSGKKVQIWVDPPGPDGSLTVHVWDYRTNRADLIATRSDLDDVLERAHVLAQQWVGGEPHTRSG